MEERKDDIMDVRTCDAETIPCKNCKWSFLFGATNSSCGKFEFKPHDVYYDSQPCPKLEERKNVN